MKLKHGYMREDGSFFWGYNKGREEWCTSEAFEKRKNASQARLNALKDKQRTALDNMKLEAGCACCHQDFHPAALAFHHRDPASKKAEVTNLIGGKQSVLDAEVKKCDIICHNCHAVLHSVLSDSAKKFSFVSSGGKVLTKAEVDWISGA
jgi:hypothetical protein